MKSIQVCLVLALAASAIAQLKFPGEDKEKAVIAEPKNAHSVDGKKDDKSGPSTRLFGGALGLGGSGFGGSGFGVGSGLGGRPHGVGFGGSPHGVGIGGRPHAVGFGGSPHGVGFGGSPHGLGVSSGLGGRPHGGFNSGFGFGNNFGVGVHGGSQFGIHGSNGHHVGGHHHGGAGFPISPIVPFSGPAPPASCRRWCRDDAGRAYCCEDAHKPETAVFTKHGACPIVRLHCPATRAFHGPPSTCSNDGACSGIDKCCFDKCLGEHVCKPPRGIGR